MTVKGYNLATKQKLLIYLDFPIEEYHRLGNVTCSSGRFTFAFKMEATFLGEHTVSAVDESDPGIVYSAKFTLKSTDPISERLFRYIYEFWQDMANNLEGWFGDNGKYSKTPQIITGSGDYELPQGEDCRIWIYDGEKPAQVHITLSFRDLESGGTDRIMIQYYLSDEFYSQCTLWNSLTSNEMDLNVCCKGLNIYALNWPSGNGETLKFYYSYVILSPP